MSSCLGEKQCPKKMADAKSETQRNTVAVYITKRYQQNHNEKLNSLLDNSFGAMMSAHKKNII